MSDTIDKTIPYRYTSFKFLKILQRNVVLQFALILDFIPSSILSFSTCIISRTEIAMSSQMVILFVNHSAM